MFRSQFVTRFGLSCLLSTSAAALALGAAAPAWAQNAPAQHSFDIPALPLNEALRLFMQQSGIQISYASGDGANVRASAVKGDLAPAAALSQLLTGTGLTYRFTAPTSAILEPAPTADAGTVQLGPVRVGADEQVSGAIPTPKTDRAATDRSHSYAARAATVAGKTAQGLREIPQSVTVVTRQQMDDRNAFSLEDALRTTPGVTALPYNQGASFFYVRGHSSEVQYDGLPSNFGVSTAPQFDMVLYDRVEVLRGPSGLLQGAGEPAGTVNLVRKRPHDTFGWAASLSGGSWNNFHGDLDVTGPLNNAGSIRGRFVASGQDRGSFIDKNHDQHGMIYGVVEADLDESTTFTLSGAAQNMKLNPFDYGAGIYSNGTFLNAPRSSFFGADWSKSNRNIRQLFSSIEHNISDNWKIKASADYRHITIKTHYAFENGYINLDNSAPFAVRNQYQKLDTFQADINLTGDVQAFGRQHKLLIGANYAYLDNLNLLGGTTITVPNVFDYTIPEQSFAYDDYYGARSWQYGVYAQARISIADPLTLLVGGRVTSYGSKERAGTPDNRSFTKDPSVNGHFTPSVGLIWDVNRQFTLYGSYASTFTAQTTSITSSGQAVNPRTGDQFEVGAKGTFLNGALNASAALFHIIDHNRAVTDPDNPDYYVAAGKVRSQGAEIEINGEPLPGWSVMAGYTYLETKYLDDPNSLGQVYDLQEPKHNFKLWTTYRIGEIDQPGFQIGGGIRALSKTSRGGPFQPAYAVVDAQIGYRLNGQWSATLTVNNLLDKTYYIRVPARFYGLYGDPRNFTVTLRKSF
ncbi:MAG: TonB-dependent siderophore receptor [Tistrella sp.]|nr:TonB-dependent siderophore receptor [Tistrella sp.]|tara:strand:+ start:1305 stop:3713 length:2409 start_codon:yes stop_codon:yes gene_type:complete